MYRDGDYDREDDSHSTASFPDGLREEYQYMPALPRAVRRTNSADDVSRFHRYFDLVRTNCGENVFKWRHYTRILCKELRSFRLPLLRVRSTLRSEGSAYFTASEAAVSTPKSTPRRGFRKLAFSEATSSSLSVRSHLKKAEFPLTLMTTCKHITAATDNFTNKNLKDLSGYKRWKYPTTGAALLCTWNSLMLSHASALQPLMTIGRSSYITLIWFLMGFAHYDGTPIWTAITCGTALNLSMCRMKLLHSTESLGVVCEETKSLARDICHKVDKITKMQPRCSKRSTPIKHRPCSSSQGETELARCGAGDLDVGRRRRHATAGARHA
ncbi:uncharacterized protein CDAR_602891 [Caerostris darwini]|uniref:Uncharacterized protein n=1 Tax=Caerostris darwini TaxID=1538125 RepID=A0AAV4VAA3_9ARAC|nr:uncharacterized protein CDAR_602891 [Caerostris darwini]